MCTAYNVCCKMLAISLHTHETGRLGTSTFYDREDGCT